MLTAMFWSLLALVTFTLVLFPALVFVRARLRPIPCRLAAGDAPLPFVSIVIAAHNEQACIARKIQNVLALDYPPNRFELLIASDGSDDATEERVRPYTGDRVRLLALPRSGKARAMNKAVAAARGEVLVFSDANSLLDRGALKALVAPLADPTVGGVAGDQRYDAPGRTACGTASCERGYWSFDRWLKKAESLGGCVISATGAIYAVRRHLFQPVPEGVTDDFVTSTRVIEQGFRLVFAEDAVAREPVAERASVEFGRKVRVISRGLRGVWVMRGLLNAWRFGFYSVQLLTHKVLRRLMVFPLLGLLVLSGLLWSQGIGYQALFLAQVVFLALAAAGSIVTRRNGRLPRWLAFPTYFCLVNLAAAVAVVQTLRGRSIVLWQPARGVGGEHVAAR